MTIHSRHGFETHTTGYTDWTNSQNLVNRKTDHLLNPLASLGFLSSAPLSASNGDGYIDSSSYYVYDGGAWYAYAGIEAGVVLDTLSNIVWVWNGSTYINFGALVLSSVTTLPATAIYNGMMSNPALFFANTLAAVNSAATNISVSPAGLAAWWANTVSTQLQNATLLEARTGTNASKLLNPDALKAVFHFGSGAGAPSGAPAQQSEGFYHDTLTNSYYVYDYVSAGWKNLTDSSNAYSAGALPPATPSHGYIFFNTSASPVLGIPSNSFAIYNSATISWDVINKQSFFAQSTAPASPQIGNLWQNTAATVVSGIASNATAYWDGSTWVQVFNPDQSISSSAAAPLSPNVGDIWHNTSVNIVSGINSKMLSYWDGSAWQRLQTYSNPVICSREIISGSQVIPSNATTKVNFPNAITDTHGAWDVVNNWFVAPEDGIYQVYSHIRFTATQTTAGGFSVFSGYYVNGIVAETAGIYFQYIPSVPVSVGHRLNSSVATVSLTAGDTLEVRVTTHSGIGAATITGSTDTQKLKIIKIGEL